MDDLTLPPLPTRSFWQREHEHRILAKAGTTTSPMFGISFLDEAIGPLLSSEFVVFGAATGVGKTSLACHIATYNARRGVRVALVGLEAQRFEIVRRIKYERVARYFHNHREQFPPEARLSFKRWYMGDCDSWCEPLDHQVGMELERDFDDRLLIVPSPDKKGVWGEGVTRDDLITVYRHLVEREGVELVVLDHVHAIDSTDSEDEYNEVRQNISKLWECICETQVPLIAFSHFRKKNLMSRWQVPPVDELHGSSELSKRATAIVTVGRAYDIRDDKGKVKEELELGDTWFSVPKLRISDYNVTRSVGLLKYDLDKNHYRENYRCFKLDGANNCVELSIRHSWMKSGVAGPTTEFRDDRRFYD